MPCGLTDKLVHARFVYMQYCAHVHVCTCVYVCVFVYMYMYVNYECMSLTSLKFWVTINLFLNIGHWLRQCIQNV